MDISIIYDTIENISKWYGLSPDLVISLLIGLFVIMGIGLYKLEPYFERIFKGFLKLSLFLVPAVGIPGLIIYQIGLYRNPGRLTSLLLISLIVSAVFLFRLYVYIPQLFRLLASLLRWIIVKLKQIGLVRLVFYSLLAFLAYGFLPPDFFVVLAVSLLALYTLKPILELGVRRFFNWLRRTLLKIRIYVMLWLHSTGSFSPSFVTKLTKAIDDYAANPLITLDTLNPKDQIRIYDSYWVINLLNRQIPDVFRRMRVLGGWNGWEKWDNPTQFSDHFWRPPWMTRDMLLDKRFTWEQRREWVENLLKFAKKGKAGVKIVVGALKPDPVQLKWLTEEIIFELLSNLSDEALRELAEKGEVNNVVELLLLMDSHSKLIQRDYLQDPAGLVIKLRDAEDPLSEYLQEQFSPNMRRILNEYDNSNSPSEVLLRALIVELNQLLRSNNLYEEQRFRHVPLTQETQELIKQNPQGLDLIRLNRLLLEEAYPYEIAKSGIGGLSEEGPFTRRVLNLVSWERAGQLQGAYNFVRSRSRAVKAGSIRFTGSDFQRQLH